MKLSKQQKRFYITGTICLCVALFLVTFWLPIARHFSIFFMAERYQCIQVELFLMFITSIYYIRAPRYYKSQMLVILISIVYYFLFVKIYPLIF